MNSVKYFPIEAVLSVTGDRLLCEIGELYGDRVEAA